MKRIKLALFLFTLIFPSIACGQFEIGVEPTANNLPENQVNITTSREKLDDHLLSDDINTNEEELENINQFIAYTDSNSNVWVLEIGSGNPRQITFDASLSYDGTNTTIEYRLPKLSSDGKLLVYSKQVGIPQDYGYDLTSNVWVENMENNDKRQILSEQTLGFSWKPNSHELSYTKKIKEDSGYWIPRGQPSPELAKGIFIINIDTNKTIELVQPERGYTLAGPRWTADAKIVYFTEVIAQEGSGLFAYFDLENKQYVTWEEPVGNVTWSENGDYISYARHTYSANGEERLYLRSRQGVEELIGPDYEGIAYATQPSFSPIENKIAYIVFEDGPLTSDCEIMVLDLDGGEPKSLGYFVDVWELAWTLDGNNLIFSTGNWEAREIISLNILDGTQSIIANGRQLSLTGK